MKKLKEKKGEIQTKLEAKGKNLFLQNYRNHLLN